MNLNPLKPKYHALYWEIAYAAAQQSVATRHQVGAVVVMPTGMISVGWNGMPAGLPNECESTYVRCDAHPDGVRPKTNPEVIHAEQNALDKMARQGVPTQGSVLFVTRAPCLQCAKSMVNLGLAAVVYDREHDDLSGVALLNNTGTLTINREEVNDLPNPSIWYSMSV